MNINQADIDLISELESFKYNKSMNGVVSVEKQDELKELKVRLSNLSYAYKEKYDNTAGIFATETSSGNPISVHGKLRRIWSGIFKGSENKQYSAQISFVINTKYKCLDVGFYFGRAASLNVRKDGAKKVKIEKWKKELAELGVFLYNKINSSEELKNAFNSLFEFGFKAEIKDQRVKAEDWLQNLTKNPSYSSIVFNLRPDENGQIEFSNIDLHVAMLLPLIAILPEQISKSKDTTTKTVKSLTPEQWAKRAERHALIGLDGERYIMAIERERLKKFGITKYPEHKSIVSDGFGYDILSNDGNGREIFIEVKTTTLMKTENASMIFFMSAEEFSFYEKNMTNYKLIRVFDIYGIPNFEEINLRDAQKIVSGYRVSLKQS